MIVREGQHPRLVPIQRRDVMHPLEIEVYSTTIEEYKLHHYQMGCNHTLNTIGVQETQVDPAEGILHIFDLLFCQWVLFKFVYMSLELQLYIPSSY